MNSLAGAPFLMEQPVPIPSDPLFPDILGSSRLVRDAVAGMSMWHEQLKLIEADPIQKLMMEWQRDEATRKTLFGQADLLPRFHDVDYLIRRQDDLLAKQLISPSAIALAQEHARLAGNFALPSVLEQFRTPFDVLSVKFMTLDLLGVKYATNHLDAFAHASAVSDLIGQSLRVDRDMLSATRAFGLSSIPAFDTLLGYRGFLDAAGLGLSHWPWLAHNSRETPPV
jgi:hypothetical protein